MKSNLLRRSLILKSILGILFVTSLYVIGVGQSIIKEGDSFRINGTLYTLDELYDAVRTDSICEEEFFKFEDNFIAYKKHKDQITRFSLLGVASTVCIIIGSQPDNNGVIESLGKASLVFVAGWTTCVSVIVVGVNLIKSHKSKLKYRNALFKTSQNLNIEHGLNFGRHSIRENLNINIGLTNGGGIGIVCSF